MRRRVLKVPPEAAGGAKFVLAVCPPGVEASRAAQDGASLLLRFPGEAEVCLPTFVNLLPILMLQHAAELHARSAACSPLPAKLLHAHAQLRLWSLSCFTESVHAVSCMEAVYSRLGTHRGA